MRTSLFAGTCAVFAAGGGAAPLAYANVLILLVGLCLRAFRNRNSIPIEIPGLRPLAPAIHFPGPTTTSAATYSTSAILPDPSHCRYTNAPSPPFARLQIGRASCRERG